jgi:hypothetical protein
VSGDVEALSSTASDCAREFILLSTTTCLETNYVLNKGEFFFFDHDHICLGRIVLIVPCVMSLAEINPLSHVAVFNKNEMKS